MIYLDYAATTPISDEALYVFGEASKKYFGNASSLHEFGTEANRVLNMCRKTWAHMINSEADGIYFTSGGTEANQLAILSLVYGNQSRGKHIITTEAEHSSVYHLCKQLEDEGFTVTFLPLIDDGQISLEQLEQAIQPTTILASIQFVNGETGMIQPVEEIGKLLKQHGVIFHADCVQAFGNVDIDVRKYHIDALSIASHKIYGPKGTGLAYINPRVDWTPVVKNTTHENGFRPGTVDVPSILAFTAAGQAAHRTLDERLEKMQELRTYFLTKLARVMHDWTVYESKTAQLPNIVALSFGKWEGQYIMLECNKRGIAISTGSACQVRQQSPSRTILSLGKSVDEAKQLVRVSFGKMTTEEEIDKLVEAIMQIVNGNEQKTSER